VSGSTGVRGFLFADLRGYTRFVETHGDDVAAELLTRYRDVVREVIRRHKGAEIRTEGDGFFIVFQVASAAVDAGLEIVEAAGSLGDAIAGVAVGIHAGETVETSEGHVGSAVNIAARVCGKAEAGEVLVTATVRGLTRTVVRHRFLPLGRRRLKGVSELVMLYRVVPEHVDLPSPVRSPRPLRRPGLFARVRRRLRSRRTRLGLAAFGAVAIVTVAAGAYATIRPPDCMTLDPSMENVVIKIDPSRGCTVAVVPAGYGPGPIVATSRAIWFGNLDDQTVTRFDLGTGATHTTSARGQVSGLAAEDAAVWVLDGRAGTLTKIDATSGAGVDALVLPSTPPEWVPRIHGGSYGGNAGYNAGYVDLVTGSDRLWIASDKEGDVLRIDPRKEDVTNDSKYPLERVSVEPRPSPSDDGFGLRWPRTGIGRLAFIGGTLWISDVAGDQLWRTDAGTANVRPVGIRARTSAVVAVIGSGGAVWIAYADGSVSRSNPATGDVRTIAVGNDLSSAAAAPDGGIWVVDPGDAEVIHLATDGSVEQRIRLASRPKGVVFAAGFVWATIAGP